MNNPGTPTEILRAAEAGSAAVEDARTRRALLHILEDLREEHRLAVEARKQWIDTVDALRDPLMVHDGDFRVVRCNQAYARCAGMEIKEILRRPYWECFPRGTGPAPACARGVEQGLQVTDEEITTDGGEVFHMRCFATDGGASRTWLSIFEDITERKNADERIRRLNRVYAVLSGINNLIVRAPGRRELFQGACRIAVDEGKFISAAIAEYDAQAEILVAVAEKGLLQGFTKDGLSTRPDGPYGRTTAARAVREQKPVWDDDLAANPALGPNRAQNMEAGARAIMSLPLFLDKKVEGVLVLFAAEKNFFDDEEVRLLSELANDISHALDYLAKSRRIEKSKAKLRRSLEATIAAIATALEVRDPYTAGHQRRVADLTAAIGREMGLPQDKVEGIHFGALIHDLGKIQVPAEILAKPTRLSNVEFELIKAHPQAGYDIIKGIDFPWPVAAMVQQHHERLDGSGYPQGLKGDAIAIEARILAVADVVEAMASHRPYRPGLGIEAALKEIVDKRGTAFDPDAVDACVRLFREGRFSLG